MQIVSVESALVLAKFYHKGQKRDDGRDYLVHLVNVCRLLKLVGAPIKVQIAGALHDILEDTKCSEHRIRETCGPRVLELVKQVTNDPITKLPNIKSPEAWMIKVCDVVDNCTDLQGWDEHRKCRYLIKKRQLLNLI